MPAAEVRACCSAMPTSMTRSGMASARGWSPTGCCMAAVMATIRSSARARDTISSANTAVHPKRSGTTGSPVSGWMRPTAWKRSATWFSAGV